MNSNEYDWAIENVGIDHGYKNMKTRGICFPSCISKIEGIPDELTGILQYNGSVYTEFGSPIQYVNSSVKSDTEEFYMLTLIALAKELKARGNITKAKINLLAGLPQKWYYKQKKDFHDYLNKNHEIKFRYGGESYDIIINDIKIYPQGYAAFMTLPNILDYLDKECCLCDIGGGTRDMVSIINGQINYEKSKIDTKASIWLIDQINETIEAEMTSYAPESVIIDYIRNGGINKPVQNQYEEIMKKELIKYADDVYTTLKKFRFNVDLIPTIFLGGGADVMANFSDNNKPNVTIINDICANAKGYEVMYSLMGGSK